MKIGTIAVKTPLGEISRVGVKTAAGVVDATAARVALLERSFRPEVARRLALAQVPTEVAQLLAAGRAGLEWLNEAVADIVARGQSETAAGETVVYRDGQYRLLAPIPRPPGIACFVTWPTHVEEGAAKGFSVQFPEKGGDLRGYYKGNPEAVVGPETTIVQPSYASETDIECEMAAVIGIGGKDLSIAQAREAIAGYCIYNDVSFRDIQMREMRFGLGPTKGKDADGCNVLGPWLVTADEVGDPQTLRMSLRLNGKELSSYNTSNMQWGFADLAAYLSRGQTLYPGQVLTSGCYPGGSGLDLELKLKGGDVVELEIEKLGSLRSTLG